MSRVFSKRFRYNFSRVPEAMSIPSLIGLQKQSYNAFLQKDIPPDQRKTTGLQAALKALFPVYDFSGRVRLDFDGYILENPKCDIVEARQKGLTYAAPLRARLKLTVYDEEKVVKSVREQEVYLGDIPLMTQEGTFVVNGVERVVVSQMHRSPGVFFDHDRTHNVSGKSLYLARVIPALGSWMDFEFDLKDILCVRIDRKRKLPITTLIMALEKPDNAGNTHTTRVPGRRDYEPIASSKPLDARVDLEAMDALDDVAEAGILDAPTQDDSAVQANSTNLEGELSLSELARLPGYSRSDILDLFYSKIPYIWSQGHWRLPFNEELWKNLRLDFTLLDADTGGVVAEEGVKLQARFIRQRLKEGVLHVLVPKEFVYTRYSAVDVVNLETGEAFAEAGAALNKDIVEAFLASGGKELEILDIDYVTKGSSLLLTLNSDKNTNRIEALSDIYRALRPGESPTPEGAYTLFNNLFFNEEKYSLSDVGRLKLNTRLNLQAPLSVHTLQGPDIIAIVRYLLELRQGRGHVDDIDSLTNRRVRSVGELLEVQYRSGLIRMQRTIRERMAAVDFETAMPNDLLNARPLSAIIREFFGTSQLSQFMDQANPLSEVNHKRRLSALGPGGVTRERASIEVRDVHPTHYGRICPVETPEGANIGLISSMAIYARVNPYGFLETPYRKVVNGRLTQDIVYISAMEEEKHAIAQADVATDEEGYLTDPLIGVRSYGDYVMVPPTSVDFADISPKQILSVAAALIPFVENDDANRALMGSNMQRQAVPLMRAKAPLVGTGVEGLVIRDSGVILYARRSGTIDQVDAGRIVILPDEIVAHEPVVDIYYLDKYRKSNAGTCIHQKPLVRAGDHVNAGDLIADGAATDKGELALGYNALVAFMPFHGCGFEDSIVLSQRLVDEDAYTSIHIDELETSARDMKLGYEEITRDIPGASDEAIRHLDEAGIAYIGAEVSPGDILVGKISPKAEIPLNPEEKLLRAIFSDKAADMKDTSLRVPAGMYGTVVDVRIFSRRGIERDERALAIERETITELTREKEVERRILEQGFRKSMQNTIMGQVLTQKIGDFPAGTVVTHENWAQCVAMRWKKILLEDKKRTEQLELIYTQHEEALDELERRFQEKIEKLHRGDDLATGILKTVKVFLAIKRKIQPGDKMAGRHGNKGVVSVIVPQEDMPYLADGTPMDIVLNPLGLPPRMNVGQILETHLGWVSYQLGRKAKRILDQAIAHPTDGEAFLRQSMKDLYKNPEIGEKIQAMSPEMLFQFAKDSTHGIPMACPVFEGAKTKEIEDWLEELGLNTSGQEILYNGRTGEPFDRPITVGVLYMLKLHHLVDEKIHARSIGPYSLVTQQPLGGKSQFGGQRFGEMEVWALQAYGAARTLLEMLTVKSDDLQGRMEVYKAIIKGQEHFSSDVPESFNVLIKELKTLGMNVECRVSSGGDEASVEFAASRALQKHHAQARSFKEPPRTNIVRDI